MDNGLRALVLEDSEWHAYVLKEALEKQGFQVEVADTVGNALAFATRFSPDVYVCDTFLRDESKVPDFLDQLTRGNLGYEGIGICTTSANLKKYWPGVNNDNPRFLNKELSNGLFQRQAEALAQYLHQYAEQSRQEPATR